MSADEIRRWEGELFTLGDDASLTEVDLQNMLQKQQQTMQMMSQISKMLHDTAMCSSQESWLKAMDLRTVSDRNAAVLAGGLAKKVNRPACRTA